jgi:tRNA ligase
LILISALSPKHVLVASKHSLGTTTESQVNVDALAGNVSSLEISKDRSNAAELKQEAKGKGKESPEAAEEKEAEAHAEVGRRWLRTTLERSGKTEAELAKRLWDSNTTAVLEVSFADSDCADISAMRRLIRGACHRDTGILDGLASAWPEP